MIISLILSKMVDLGQMFNHTRYNLVPFEKIENNSKLIQVLKTFWYYNNYVDM
jgi:hypothetical protein